MKQYAQLKRKLASMLNRKRFLLECRRKGVVPDHIVSSMKSVHSLLAENGPYVNKIGRAFEKFQRTVLNFEIKQTFFKIGKLQGQVAVSEENTIQATTQNTAARFFDTQNVAFQKNLEKLCGTPSQ